MLVKCKNVPSDRISNEYGVNLRGKKEVQVDGIFFKMESYG